MFWKVGIAKTMNLDSSRNIQSSGNLVIYLRQFFNDADALLYYQFL